MKLVNYLSLIVAGFVVANLVGCASVVDGNSKRLSIKTDPPGAKVTIYDLKHPIYDKITPKVAVMYTPAVIPLRTGGHYQTVRYFVTIEKPGYKPLGFEVHSRVNGWYFGNLNPVLLPLFPITMGMVDPMTGAMWTIEPSHPEHTYELKEQTNELQDISKIPEENVDVPIIHLPVLSR